MAGLDTIWVPQNYGIESLTLIAAAGRRVPDIELGTAVVPTYSRHPLTMASQALTAQAACGGGASPWASAPPTSWPPKGSWASLTTVPPATPAST